MNGFLIACLLVPSPCSATDAFKAPESPFRLQKRPDEPRNYFFPPLYSLLIPGFDQIIEGQSAGAVYLGVAAAGITYASLRAGSRFRQGDQFSITDKSERDIMLAGALYQTSGFLSTYHSFRTAVRSQKPHGKFTFLTEEETPGDLLLAPFKFSHLGKWTTIVPLVAAAGLAIGLSDTLQHFRIGDAFYSFGFAYNAGVGEEAAFRGFLMPAFSELFGSPLLGNLASGSLFALLHTTDPKHLWHQLLWAWYIGWVSQHRNWTISETIFIHTWWDVILIATAFANTGGRNLDIRFPLLSLQF